MKRWWLTLGLGLLAACIMPAAASAHILKTDGHISTILHTDPNDSPISDTPTNFILFFGDDTNKFNLNKCNCTVSISEQGRPLATLPLVQTSPGLSDGQFNFPKPDVYTLTVTGAPQTPNAFQSFTTTYDLRVEAGQSKNQSLPPLLWAALGFAMAMIFVIAYALNT